MAFSEIHKGCGRLYILIISDRGLVDSALRGLCLIAAAVSNNVW